MRLYTVHGEPPREATGPEGWPEAKPRPPVLVREGFSLRAFVFGFLWFLFNRLWWEALGLLALTLLAAFALPDPYAGLAVFGLHLIAGFEARDRLRARLARRGLPVLGVVAAPDEDIAWFRLGQQRPDLVKAVP
ncbi:DUF2628 domain-containing protein [Falsiroseomonas oryziterrae]|uniref:DUF2628 domain-containing protein n=1 Tax=Falsiroseomonas oryziterrae TaxID=2911368 RepID=UPI001F2C934B|nr:DUF2628 domain-containing protein [Roseomonas sp. NPKOSM-4]